MSGSPIGSARSCPITCPGCSSCANASTCLVFEGPVGPRGATGVTGDTGVSTTSTVDYQLWSSTNEIVEAPPDGTPGDLVLWTNESSGDAVSLLVWNGITDEWVYASDGLDAFTV